MLASRCNAINDRDSRFISRGLRRQKGSTGHADRYPEVLVLYLKCPRAKSGELSCCGGALQIQRLEGSRPGGLWDLYLDGAVLIVCEFAVAIRALGFQERVAERTGVGKRIRESESRHLTAF
jgi:hypothetical protein